MRFPSQQLRKEITFRTGIIRELHIYSEALPIGAKPGKQGIQHRGFGKKLIGVAEKIARDNGKDKMVVISGIGAKQYYIEKLGIREMGLM